MRHDCARLRVADVGWLIGQVALTALDFGLEREGVEEEYEQSYPPLDSAPVPQGYHPSSSPSSPAKGTSC